MMQAEFNAWIRARFNLWTKSDVDAAIKAEREACALVCDGLYKSWINIEGRYEFMGEGAEVCADEIRARGKA